MHRALSEKVNFLVISLLAGALSTQARAQPTQPLCEAPLEPKHVLGGHAFLPVLELPPAFADSRASLALSAGTGSYPVNVAGTDYNVNLATLSPYVDLQINVWKSLAVFGSLSGNLTTGLNSESALIYGGSVKYVWGLGALYEVIRDDNNVLSVAFQVNRPHTFAVSPVDVASAVQQEIIEASSDPNYASSTVETEYRPNLRFAHGFNPTWGVQATLGFNFKSTVQNGLEGSGNQATLGVGLSADLNPQVGFPLGVTLNYTRNQILSQVESNADTLSLGLWETLGHRCNAGIEGGWTRRNGLDSAVGVVMTRLYYN
jgi:hypothetical protein